MPQLRVRVRGDRSPAKHRARWHVGPADDLGRLVAGEQPDNADIGRRHLPPDGPGEIELDSETLPQCKLARAVQLFAVVCGRFTQQRGATKRSGTLASLLKVHPAYQWSCVQA